MNLRRIISQSEPQIFAPVLWLFSLKTLLFGILMTFCNFQFYPRAMQFAFPHVNTVALSFLMGWGFLLVGIVGVYGQIMGELKCKLVFLLAGIGFAAVMGTEFLIRDFGNVNGVSFWADAMVLIWVFLNISINARRYV